MIQVGKVLSSDSDKALVQVVRQSACGGSCGNCKLSCEMNMLIEVPNTIDAKYGEFVNIETDSKNVLGAAAFYYIFTLFFLVVGIFLGKWIFPDSIGTSSDMFAFGVSFVLYVLSLFVIHKVTKSKEIKYEISKKYN